MKMQENHCEKNNTYKQMAIKLALFGSSITFASWILDSWVVGTIVIFMILFHEWGHLKAAEFFNIKHKGMYFLPGIGAVAVLDEEILDRETEFYVAFAGPFFGLIFTLVLTVIATFTDQYLLYRAGAFCAGINLFNLIVPISPLDGGRIMKSITFSMNRRLGLVTLILGVFGAIYLLSQGLWIFALIAVGAVVEFSNQSKNSHKFKSMGGFEIFSAIVKTIGCATFLFLFMAHNVVPMDRIENEENVKLSKKR